MPYAVGDRVLIRVDQDGAEPTYVSGTVSTVSDETPYGVTIDGDDVESTWYVDSELSDAPAEDQAPVPEPDPATTAAARRGTRKIERQPNAAAVRLDATKRIKAIVKSEEAVGREALAEHFAYDTSMSATEARAALAKSPKVAAKAAAPANRFEAAMSASPNPQVGPDGGGDGNADEGAAFADRYFSAKREARNGRA